MIMKIRESGKKSNLKLYKKENTFTRRDAKTYCSFFQSSMQTITFHVHMSYNLNFHRCSSLKARKLSLSGSGLVILNTSELTTVKAPSQYSRIKIMNFPEPAQSNPNLPYPVRSVTLEKQLTVCRPKSLSAGNQAHVLHLMYFRQVKNFIRTFQTGFQEQQHTELGAKGRGVVSCKCTRKKNRNTLPGVFKLHFKSYCY